MKKKPVKKKQPFKPIADMTVGEFERSHKTKLPEENKDMMIPAYFRKIGFPEFADLILG
jgi:hypothetical protein